MYETEYVIVPVMGHYEAYLRGRFICSGDTYAEVENELRIIESNA